MAKQRDIWRFNEDEWKVHISDNALLERVKKKIDLGNLNDGIINIYIFKGETYFFVLFLI